MTDFFLFADFETTGLDPRSSTLLELGWSVLDDRLNQLTPVRRRYLALRADEMPPITPSVNGNNVFWSSYGEGAEPPQIVRDMHKKSGLIADWVAAPPVSVLRSIGDVDRLLIDDLVQAGWKGSKDDKVYLAGAGVSHFDHLVFKEHGSQLIRQGVFHYSSVDSSVAARTLGIDVPKDAAAMDKFLDGVFIKTGAQQHMAWSTAMDADRPLRSFCSNMHVEFDNLNPHRAPDDVAWSIVFARLLRLLSGSDKVGSRKS